jgi:hypothetical protein
MSGLELEDIERRCYSRGAVSNDSNRGRAVRGERK